MLALRSGEAFFPSKPDNSSRGLLFNWVNNPEYGSAWKTWQLLPDLKRAIWIERWHYKIPSSALLASPTNAPLGGSHAGVGSGEMSLFFRGNLLC